MDIASSAITRHRRVRMGEPLKRWDDKIPPMMDVDDESTVDVSVGTLHGSDAD